MAPAPPKDMTAVAMPPPLRAAKAASVGPPPPSAPSCFGRTAAWRGWRVVRAQPARFLGLAALLLLVLVGAGVGTVLGVAATAARDDQARAQALVSSVATSFGAQLLGSLSPSLAAQAFVQAGPSPTHAAVQAWFVGAAPLMLASSVAIDDLQLAPYGHAAAIYPLVTLRRNATGLLLGGDVGGGHDLFNASSVIANRRSAAILALTRQQLQIEGPKTLLSGATTCLVACGQGQSGLLSRIPLFVSTSSVTDTWSQGYNWDPAPGGPPVGPFTSVTGCATVTDPATGMSLCDTNATGDGRRFWGFFTVIVVWTQLLQLAQVGSLGDGFRWSIARSAESSTGTGTFPWVVVSSSDGPLPTSAYPGGAVSEVQHVYSSAWIFTIEPRSGTWLPAWQTGALAGVVVLASVLAGLVLFLTVQQCLNEDLLYSMLPRRIVQRMRAGETELAEPFAHATVLFTDIVGFTDLVATITPADTMSMLNFLFSDFDAIAQRLGVVKLETIGDAFVAFVVAGEPHAQALQMAECALAMVDCAARHELPNGGELRIRVGVHCGPVVAGVVGRTLPHYSLFGDTINTTARMESHSIPGRVHVSSSFARTLRQAEDAAEASAAAAAGAGAPPPPPFAFVLQSRGNIAVKGKGVMATHFLLRRGDALAPSEMVAAGPASPGSITGSLDSGLGSSASF
jgi:class 3 adenylate cyclase